MEVVFESTDEKLALRDHTIRSLSTYCDECEKHFSSTHFQAVVKDLRKKKGNSITCRLLYENKDGEFLGVDENSEYGSTNTNESVISMPISIPETSAKVRVSLYEKKYPGIPEYTDYIIGIAVIALIIFAVKGLFNW